MSTELDAINVTEQNSNLTLQMNLIDIEAPLAPVTDWSILGEWALWSLFLLILISLLAKFSFKLYRPAYLRWQLSKLSLKNNQDKYLSFKQVWLFYGWCLQLKKTISTSATTETTPALKALNTLIERVNQLSFSKQPVSRETYQQLLDQADRTLKMNCGFQPLLTRLFNTVKAKLKGAN
ncbi:MAG: hypothetical protein ISEC1_P0361 [Thiomicrorhabdus sp.]|nr:MAG: hypothetical protein ISEC1_P0361 [Thiomicrorhabdus sp.]